MGLGRALLKGDLDRSHPGDRDATESPGPDNTVGIAAELTASQPGRYEITDVRLRYRLNGGPEQVGQGIDAVWTVCADDPAPADCPED